MTYTTVDLAGKVALVTGGSRGIGAAIARRLARDGAAVAVTYNASPEKAEAVVREIEAAGGRALAVRADSADVGGMMLVLGTVDQYSIDDFDRMVAVNVRAVFVAVQEAARHLKPGGRVINIGSMVADRTGFPGASVYGMTKAAVASLTRGLAIDLAPRGITVNNVQPGPTETDMNPKDGPHYDLVVNMLPVKRAGTSDEIAGMVSYLASAEAAFVTGASLTIDGGLTA